MDNDYFEDLERICRTITSERISSRKRYNLLVLSTLLKIIEKYPDLRFCQILEEINKGGDYFYEEPRVTLERFKAFLNDEENI